MIRENSRYLENQGTDAEVSARFYAKIGGIRSRIQEEQRKMSEIHRKEQGKCTISTEALLWVYCLF